MIKNLETFNLLHFLAFIVLNVSLGLYYSIIYGIIHIVKDLDPNLNYIEADYNLVVIVIALMMFVSPILLLLAEPFGRFNCVTVSYCIITIAYAMFYAEHLYVVMVALSTIKLASFVANFAIYFIETVPDNFSKTMFHIACINAFTSTFYYSFCQQYLGNYGAYTVYIITGVITIILVYLVGDSSEMEDRMGINENVIKILNYRQKWNINYWEASGQTATNNFEYTYFDNKNQEFGHNLTTVYQISEFELESIDKKFKTDNSNKTYLQIFKDNFSKLIYNESRLIGYIWVLFLFVDMNLLYYMSAYSVFAMREMEIDLQQFNLIQLWCIPVTVVLMVFTAIITHYLPVVPIMIGATSVLLFSGIALAFVGSVDVMVHQWLYVIVLSVNYGSLRMFVTLFNYLVSTYVPAEIRGLFGAVANATSGLVTLLFSAVYIVAGVDLKYQLIVNLFGTTFTLVLIVLIYYEIERENVKKK